MKEENYCIYSSRKIYLILLVNGVNHCYFYQSPSDTHFIKKQDEKFRERKGSRPWTSVDQTALFERARFNRH